MSLMVEATNDHFTLPEKGLVGRHAIFDTAMLDTPHIDEAFKAQQDERTWTVSVKRRNALSTVTYPFNPLDAVGWHGDLSVVRINWRDLRPLMSHRAHLPPSAHTTFMAGRFVVCSLRAAAVRERPGGAEAAVLPQQRRFRRDHLLSQGQLLQPRQHPSRHDDGASLGLHPWAASQGVQRRTKGTRTETDEVAVMVDTRDAVDIAALPGRRRVRRLCLLLASAGDEAGCRVMKLASLKEAGRDGTLIVVDRELKRAVRATNIVPTLQKAIEAWPTMGAEAQRARRRSARRQGVGSFELDTAALAAPLPRAYQWADGSAYVVHVELVRKARGVEMPPASGPTR